MLVIFFFITSLELSILSLLKLNEARLLTLEYKLNTAYSLKYVLHVSYYT